MNLDELNSRFWDWFSETLTVEDADGDTKEFREFEREWSHRTLRDGYLSASWFMFRKYMLEPLDVYLRAQWFTLLMYFAAWVALFVWLDNSPKKIAAGVIPVFYTPAEAAALATLTLALMLTAGYTAQYIFEQATSE